MHSTTWHVNNTMHCRANHTAQASHPRCRRASHGAYQLPLCSLVLFVPTGVVRALTDAVVYISNFSMSHDPVNMDPGKGVEDQFVGVVDDLYHWWGGGVPNLHSLAT